MAKKRASPSKQSNKSGRKTAKKGSIRVTKAQAERMALLQLRIGRASHLYSMAAAFALAASGVLLLLTQPGRLLEDLPIDTRMVLPWLMPIVAGALIAASALYLKWRPYASARSSHHFVLTVVALLVAIATFLLLTLQNLQGFNPQSLVWVYPSALAGISLTLISLALTWRGWGRRKILSILAAAFPMALMVYGFNPIFSTGIPPDLLILTFMGSAVAVQFSGSMLHISATSNRVQRREMIRVTNDRLQLLSKELKSQKKSGDYKAKALRAKEADLEVNEKALKQRLRSVDEGRKELESLQAKVSESTAELRQLKKQIGSREADVATREQKLGLGEKEVASREAEVKKTLKRLSKQETQVSRQEQKVEAELAGLRDRTQELADQEKELREAERAQRNLKGEVDAARKGLMERESELRLKESALEMKGGGEGLAARKVSIPKQLKRLEARLLEKEKELSQRELQVKRSTHDLEAAVKRSEERAKKAERQIEKMASQGKDLSARDKELAHREGALRQRENDLEREKSVLESSLASAREKEGRYEQLFKEARSQASSARHTEQEVQDALAAAQAREAKVDKMRASLEEEREEINAKLQTVLRKEKEVEARESETKLRILEAKKKIKDMPISGDARAVAEREKALELRERRLEAKQREIKSRLYDKAKALEEKEHAIKKGLTIVEADEAEEPKGPAALDGERTSSGIPRLNDLMMGGIPTGSQILYVGPAFVGKEVAILNFIAEGLRNGVPCVVITTSRPPNEVAKDMGPILPSFMEYEQLGLIRWIDGSTPLANPKKKTPIVEGNTYVVAGAGDYEGILGAMNQIVEELSQEEHPFFKLAYMTLSTSLMQGSEREGMGYVQRFVNGMREIDSVGIYAVEGGMHEKQQIEALEHQMDGAIHFRQERQKSQLQVAGIADAQTRDWVEYRHDNRTLRLGAFQLERIR
ncbi:MAG: ATPase domain-containing protein [Thermoplasmata archaeon]